MIADGLYYELTGDRGEPLVLVHGSWGDHHNWDAVVPALARSFRVLTYDRRGHSQSVRPSTPGSIQEDADDLAGLITLLGLAPAHIAGNSFGGSIVLQLAIRRPELFASLSVHEPPLTGLLAGHPAAAAVSERLASVVGRLQSGDVDGGTRQFVETVAFGPGAWAQLPIEIRNTFVFNAPTFLDEVNEPEAFVVDLAALAAFARPALLTQGDQSPPFFVAILNQLAAALPSAKRHTYTGAGHVPQVTHPQDFVRVLGDFVRQIS